MGKQNNTLVFTLQKPRHRWHHTRKRVSKLHVNRGKRVTYVSKKVIADDN